MAEKILLDNQGVATSVRGGCILLRTIFKTSLYSLFGIKEIAFKAINKKTGARGLRSILENILLKTMFDLPSQDNIEEVIVDINALKRISQPIVIQSKKTDKTTAA